MIKKKKCPQCGRRMEILYKDRSSYGEYLIYHCFYCDISTRVKSKRG